MLTFIEGLGVKYEPLRQVAHIVRIYLYVFFFLIWFFLIFSRFTFTSERKRMSTIVKLEDANTVCNLPI